MSTNRSQKQVLRNRMAITREPYMTAARKHEQHTAVENYLHYVGFMKEAGLHAVVSQTGGGKSLLLKHVAWGSLLRNKRTAFVSFDNHKEGVFTRIVNFVIGTSPYGHYGSHEMQAQRIFTALESGVDFFEAVEHANSEDVLKLIGKSYDVVIVDGYQERLTKIQSDFIPQLSDWAADTGTTVFASVQEGRNGDSTSKLLAADENVASTVCASYSQESGLAVAIKS